MQPATNARTYTLNEQDEQFLEHTLGEMPTKTGAWILLNKLLMQKQAQVAAANTPSSQDNPAE
jgi:hypothetical protein